MSRPPRVTLNTPPRFTLNTPLHVTLNTPLHVTLNLIQGPRPRPDWMPGQARHDMVGPTPAPGLDAGSSPA